MTLTESFYRAAQTLARAASPLLDSGESKLARGLRARRTAVELLEASARERLDSDRALVWFHAPSVGEGLQARAVIEALRTLRPDLQVAYTHFSPSAEALAARMPADLSGILPWDLSGPMERALCALAPALVVFTKSEVWPTLSARAAERGVPTALVAATLPASSSRTGPLARNLLAPSYARLASVLAIADDDARRLEALGARREAIHVTGDPGIDSAAERASGADPASAWLAPFHAAPGAPTLVAGSTWPEDEAVLVPAATAVRESGVRLRLVVAPHEPDQRHVPPLLRRLEAAGWRVRTLGQIEAAGELDGADAVVVDRVGVLAQLYTVGTVAYVGGGFGHEGLHSVLEPAAAGLPVLFGPHHGNARAAADLIATGGARSVRDGPSLTEILRRWIADPAEREHAARKAHGYIEQHRGAARRSAEALLPLLPESPFPSEPRS